MLLDCIVSQSPYHCYHRVKNELKETRSFYFVSHFLNTLLKKQDISYIVQSILYFVITLYSKALLESEHLSQSFSYVEFNGIQYGPRVN